MNELSAGPLAFFAVYLLGLALNLTPCVYPMLAITVSLFRRQGEDSRASSAVRALVYVGGMALMYSSLGVLAALTGSLMGSVLSHPLVLTLIGIMIVWFAGTLLGWYPFQFSLNFLTSLQNNKSSLSLFRFFSSGLFVGLFAAPCIGPPIISLMAFVSTQGDPFYGFLLFFVLALGLGTPYLFLGTYSGLIDKLPKSGMWMVWVEKFFGVILLAVGSFYLSSAWIPVLIEWILPMALIAGSVYLGFIEKSSGYSVSFNRFRRTLAILLIFLTAVWFLNSPSEKLHWEPYTPAKFEEAKQMDRPIVIDFYADWCLPCHELEHFTFSNPQVIKAMGAFSRLRVDLTRSPDATTETLLESYQLRGVPTILFLDSSGQEYEHSRIEGFLPPKAFLKIIHSLPISFEKNEDMP